MNRICAILVAFALSTHSAFGQTKSSSESNFVFEKTEGGIALLTTKDEFIVRMSQFDRSARMKTDRDISETEYLQFIANEVLPWTQDERQSVVAAIVSIADALKELKIQLPSKAIRLIKTTGNEEGNAAYTRGDAIIIPVGLLHGGDAQLPWLIAHELFHVISRQNPALREAFYNAIGFVREDEIAFPPDLASRKITNPDAPLNNHFIRVRVDGVAACATPILFSSDQHYDTQRGGEFFDYLQFEFLITEQPYKANGAIEANFKLVELSRLTGFFEQVGENTDYLIHPEEILADNFALLVTRQKEAKSPAVLEKMRAIFAAFAQSGSSAKESNIATPNTSCN